MIAFYFGLFFGSVIGAIVKHFWPDTEAYDE